LSFPKQLSVDLDSRYPICHLVDASNASLRESKRGFCTHETGKKDGDHREHRDDDQYRSRMWEFKWVQVNWEYYGDDFTHGGMRVWCQFNE
jgi:hypothetical protein